MLQYLFLYSVWITDFIKIKSEQLSLINFNLRFAASDLDPKTRLYSLKFVQVFFFPVISISLTGKVLHLLCFPDCISEYQTSVLNIAFHIPMTTSPSRITFKMFLFNNYFLVFTHLVLCFAFQFLWGFQKNLYNIWKCCCRTIKLQTYLIKRKRKVGGDDIFGIFHLNLLIGNQK